MTFDAFLAPHAAWSRHDRDVSLATNGQPARATALGVQCFPVPIEREIRPWSDLRALVKLIRLFRRERFDVIHSVTPKAGLLAMLAAKMAGVPNRVHSFTGQVWVTRRGFSRWMLRRLDRVVAATATRVLADSRSQAAFLVAERIVAGDRISVLADGSICGVNLRRFRPDPVQRAAIRAELGIEPAAMVFLFIGRLTRDKGVKELAAAFAVIVKRHPAAALVLVGPDEERLQPALETQLRACRPRVRFVGSTRRPEGYMMAADVVCLPSHREGFGSVIIEAAACGCPCIASRIYGVIDAVVEGETGLLHPVKDVRGLTEAMERILEDPALRRQLGAHALERAKRCFAEERVVEELAAFHRGLFAS